MGPKGKTDAGKKQAESGVLPFGQTPYGTEEAITSVTLLSSTEEVIVLKAIYNLCKYAQQRMSNVNFLFQLGLMEKLQDLIRKTTNQSILNFCLKLLGMFMNIPSAVKALTDCKNYTDLLKINSIFQTATDPKVQEFSSQILSKVVTNTIIASMLFNTDVISSIYKVLQNCVDPDIIKNTLEYHRRLIDCQEAVIVLPKMTDFSPNILFCYLKSEFPEIQHLAIDILVSTTSWKNRKLQLRYKDSGIVQCMLCLILNNEYPDLHQKAFDVIRNCFDFPETATYFIGTVEFLEFALWAKKCPKKYMFCAATIFKVLTDYESARQLLFDFAVEESILSMFRTNNEKVLQKTCEAVSNLTNHKYCCDKMLTPVVIKCLIEILQRKDIPTIPYIETALKTVHDFLKRNRKMLHVFPLYGGLVSVADILKSQNEMTQNGFTILLDIIYIYCTEEQYRTSLMDKELYMKILQLFSEENEDFSKKAIAILDQSINDQESRVYFSECSGTERILSKLKESVEDEELLKYILIFISRSFIYKSIGLQYLTNEALTVLKNLEIKDREINLMKERLMDMIYDLYLPIKFFDKNRLDVTDCIRDRFYMVCGCWRGSFPFLEILESQQISTCKTIYVADFTTPSDLLKVPCLFRRECSSRSTLQTGSRKESTQKDKRLSNVSGYSASATSLCNIIFERVSPEINYGGLSPDPYLTEYLEELYIKLHGEKALPLSVADQIKIIAEFIAKRMSGSEKFTNAEKQHSYKIHINALKGKLGTNMIPIGYLRQGSYCERALLFKALADKLAIPSTLVKGMEERHWNEVPLELGEDSGLNKKFLYFVVDLLFNVGSLLEVGKPEAIEYCGLTTGTPCD
ncbi:armadillo repeat-containing protein 3 [Agrilus planipennis]|uniref:Armadillo repeat-containing protein 3 n=1 Tax=Agrilus planipennis TaxID=224129 RepID=A0A1W4XD14_AGRPL|nr:armadillo repeat-containing protein 3 [Agrilus planipennis]